MRTKRPHKSPWYTRSRRAQQSWKATTQQLPEEARAAGLTWVEHERRRFTVGPFPVCLPESCAALNLLPGVREEALRRFAAHDIEWHGWTPGPDGQPQPSTHLLDSQIQCVNALLSLANRPGALLAMVRAKLPQATRLIAIEDEREVAFEWIGAADYLGERVGQARHRGRLTTSADALMVAERADGGRTAVLVEWKFTESYSTLPVQGWVAALRHQRYAPHYSAAARLFSVQPPLDAFFQEPHYQLLRQALLAWAMVRHGELGVDQALLLHVVPAGNRALRTTLTPALTPLGSTVDAVWERLLPEPQVRYAWMDSALVLDRCPSLAERYLSCGAAHT